MLNSFYIKCRKQFLFANLKKKIIRFRKMASCDTLGQKINFVSVFLTNVIVSFSPLNNNTTSNKINLCPYFTLKKSNVDFQKEKKSYMEFC